MASIPSFLRAHQGRGCHLQAARGRYSLLPFWVPLLLPLLSLVSRVRLCATPQTAAHQAPPSPDSPGKSTGVGCHCLPRLSSLRAHQFILKGGHNHWWLWHPLFTDVAGSVPFLTSDSEKLVSFYHEYYNCQHHHTELLCLLGEALLSTGFQTLHSRSLLPSSLPPASETQLSEQPPHIPFHTLTDGLGLTASLWPGYRL